jgi:hypothetical protein
MSVRFGTREQYDDYDLCELDLNGVADDHNWIEDLLEGAEACGMEVVARQNTGHGLELCDPLFDREPDLVQVTRNAIYIMFF